MAHTFVIRFGRSAGLAGLLEAPANSFRWKGSGSLSIDAQGLSIAVKRGILSLFARHRSQRIPASSIREVYREGEALRVEFATEGNARTTLPFWARDRETAAQIVQLLPTSRTFELEHTTDAPDRSDGKRMPLVLVAAVLLAGAALFIGFNRSAPLDTPTAPDVTAAMSDAPVTAVPEILTANQDVAVAPRPAPLSSLGEPITPEEARLLAILAEDPVDWTSPPPGKSVVLPSNGPGTSAEPPPADAAPAAAPEAESFVPDELPELRVSSAQQAVPIQQGTLAYDAGRQLLARFETTAAGLREEHLQNRRQFESGALSKRMFVRHLHSFQERWRELGVRLVDDREWQGPALTGLRGSLAAVTDYQQRYFDGYASGLLAGRQRDIERAFADLASAEELLVGARAYIR